MADKTIEVKVTESGLEEVRKKAAAVNKELDKVEQPRVVKSATRTGSRAADAALSISDVGLQRGSSGAGGRGGERDFARQAQGLGGLVHLYATFAANIYAVSAAFSALQKAADFERMAQSSEKMSAVLGINLKSAANSMVLLTDGAVSYTDAIEKTNLAASAGLSTKQIDALTKVAKGASTALGRDMGDSLNRLVKGTVKLEPELLDELGILTKASEAYSKYALNIGKSADELTKFEKTQAFVNAVIEEGNSKFSVLNGTVDTNPYTRLSASLENLEKKGLSVVNSVLKPVVSFLADSPVGLAAAIALVVGKLAKLAMPELLAGLATRVERASMALEKSSASFKTANEAVFKSFESTVGYATISSNSKSKILKEASALRKQLNDSILTDFELSGTGPVQYSAGTTKLIAEYEKKLSNYKNRLEGRSNLGTKSTKDLAAIKQELLLLEDMKQSYAKLADNEQIAGSARNKENKATLELLKANRSLRVTELIMDGDHLGALKLSYALEAQITREKIAQSRILSKIPGAGAVGGAFGGAMGAAGTAAMSVASKLSGIATAVAVGAALYEGAKWALGEAKSMNDLDAAVQGATDSHTLLAERLSTINKLMQAGTTSTEMYAKAQQLIGNSMGEAADSIQAVYDNYRKVQAQMYGENAPRALFSRGSEIVSTMLGSVGLGSGDSLTSSTKAIATTITDTLATTTEENSPRLRSALANALQIDVKDIDSIDKTTTAIERLLTVGDVVGLDSIRKIIQDLGRESSNTASQINAAAAAVAEANKEAKGIEYKATLKNPKYASLYEAAQDANKATGTQGTKLGETLFGGMDTQLKAELSKVNPVISKFLKDGKGGAGLAEAVKALPGAIAKLPGKGDVSPDMSFPKDRLRSEKAYVETLKYELNLIEQQKALNEQDLAIANDRFGLAGEQYNALLDEKVGLFAAAEAQKYFNSLQEAELKLNENILSIKNDKNTLDKPAAIAAVNTEYENQVKLLEKGWEYSVKRIENEVQVTALKKLQRDIELQASKAAASAAATNYAKTISKFGPAAQFSEMEAASIQKQLVAKTAILEKTKAEAIERYGSIQDSAEVNKLLTEQLDLATKLYQVQRAANQDALKAFELTGRGGVTGFIGNFGREFSYQVQESLKAAKSSSEVLLGGIISGVDNTINELTMQLKEGTFSVSSIVSFARNELADAFQKSAAQVLQNGWKQVITQLIPAAADPLTIATTAATSGMVTLTAAISALNVTLGGQAITGAPGASSGLFGFLGGLFGGSSTAAGTGALTAPSNLALNTAVAPVSMVAANGGIMSEFGPLKLNKYAKGGIATGPQAAIYGEGSKNEAYVPLPDNRTIPVTLNGNSGSNVTVGDTTINVTVDSKGNAQMDTSSNSEIAKNLGLAIKKTVQEELMNQVRPGGMFYGKR